MKRSTIILLVIIGVIVVAVLYVISLQNSLVKKDQKTKETWGNVETAYDKRYNLVDNLVNIVRGEANFEKGTLEAVVKARSDAFSTKLDPSQLTPENIKRYQDAQNTLSGAIGRIAMIQEQYPNLRTNESFKKLMDNLTEMENQIKVERKKFNEAVGTYNTAVLSFPGSLVASMLGYKEKGMFTAAEGADKRIEIPKDAFDTK